MIVAVDTNVLGYAEGLDDVTRKLQANELLGRIGSKRLVMPVQVACELHRLLMRRRRSSAAEAAEVVLRWQVLLPRHPPTLLTTLQAGLELAQEHRLQIFDAVILAASSEAGCRMLLSEHMQDGFVWRGVTVVNPFRQTPHPMLVDIMRP